MVMPGQFLERMVVIPVGDLHLEGLYHRGEHQPVVIAPPHPFYGGSMDSPVLNETAYAFYRIKHASLRFNFKGVAASQGQMTDRIESAVEDYRAAITQILLTCRDHEKVIAAGYSYGAYVAFRTALEDARVEKLLLIAPPIRLMDFTRLKEIAVETHIIAAGNDEYAPLLKVKALANENLENVRLHVIETADHFFGRGLGQIGAVVREQFVPEGTVLMDDDRGEGL